MGLYCYSKAEIIAQPFVIILQRNVYYGGCSVNKNGRRVDQTARLSLRIRGTLPLSYPPVLLSYHTEGIVNSGLSFAAPLGFFSLWRSASTISPPLRIRAAIEYRRYFNG